MANEYAVKEYYLPEHDGFDPTIARLLQQLRAGYGVTIHRADGVTLRLSADRGATHTDAPALWEARPTVRCWICDASWADGYVGFDHAGRVVATVCTDCASNLAAQLLDAELAGEGGR